MSRSVLGAPHLHTSTLLLMCLLGVFPVDVILPSLPALATAFGSKPEAMAYAVSGFALGVALSQLLIGPLSDSMGRKRLLMAGLALSIAGALGCVLSSDYQTFMIFRLVQALGCGSFVLTQALVQDLYTAEQRNTMRILLTTASGLFISLSPLAGAVLEQQVGWQGSFVAFIAVAVMVMGLSTRLHDAPASRAMVGAGSYRILAKDSDFIIYSVLCSLAFACHFSFIVVSPLLLMETLGLTPYQFSLVFIGYGLAYICGGAIGGMLNRRITAHTQIKAGLVLIATAGVTLLGWLQIAGISIPAILAPMIVCTTGTILIRPVATTLALSRHPELAGAAASLNTTILFAGGGLVSSLLASFAQTLALGLAMVLVAAAMIGGVLLCTLSPASSTQLS